MTNLSVFNTSVRTDEHGRYCLNDLHKAAIAKGEATASQRPANYLKSAPIKAFIDALDSDIEPVSSKCGGAGKGGTYATKPVLLGYAEFIYGNQFKKEVYRKVGDLGSILRAIESFEVPEDLPDMYVYAIRESDTGNVKLGISRNPESRLKQLQTGNSSKLELVAYRKAENRYQDEVLSHRLNAGQNIHGEWFSPNATLDGPSGELSLVERTA